MKLEKEDCCRNCIYQSYDGVLEDHYCAYHNYSKCGDEEGFCADIRHRFNIDKATEVNRDLHLFVKLMEATGYDAVELLHFLALGACDAAYLANKENNLFLELRARRAMNEAEVLIKKYGKKVNR